MKPRNDGPNNAPRRKRRGSTGSLPSSSRLLQPTKSSQQKQQNKIGTPAKLVSPKRRTGKMKMRRHSVGDVAMHQETTDLRKPRKKGTASASASALAGLFTPLEFELELSPHTDGRAKSKTTIDSRTRDLFRTKSPKSETKQAKKRRPSLKRRHSLGSSERKKLEKVTGKLVSKAKVLSPRSGTSGDYPIFLAKDATIEYLQQKREKLREHVEQQRLSAASEQLARKQHQSGKWTPHHNIQQPQPQQPQWITNRTCSKLPGDQEQKLDACLLLAKILH